MPRDLTKALDNVGTTYEQLVSIANDIVEKCTKSVDYEINIIKEKVNSMSNDDIRNSMLSLALKSYSFSELKEKSAMKAECAEILQKEAYAREFNGSDGSVAVRENNATLNISEEILTNVVYSMVSSTLKTKLDECHRVVDVLKNILISRASEAKMSQTTSVGEVGERTYLTE